MDVHDQETVETLMTACVYSISPNDSAQSAARLMLETGVGMLPVEVPGVGAILGVVTDRDIVLQVVAKALPTSTTICEFMTVAAETCSPRDSVLSAVEKMAAAQLHRLVVVDEGKRAIGILSLSDVVNVHPSMGSEFATVGEAPHRQTQDG